MNEKEIIRKEIPKKSIALSIRITKKHSEWMKEKNFSPTGIFLEASKELGHKE